MSLIPALRPGKKLKVDLEDAAGKWALEGRPPKPTIPSRGPGGVLVRLCPQVDQEKKKMAETGPKAPHMASQCAILCTDLFLARPRRAPFGSAVHGVF